MPAHVRGSSPFFGRASRIFSDYEYHDPGFGLCTEATMSSSAKTAAADRLHPELWDEIKIKWHKGAKGGQAGKWNARKAQLAVQEYKRESEKRFGDSGYRTKRPGKRNTLVKWTKEDWGYVSKSARAQNEGDGRYLPREVREKLTPSEKKKENKVKKGKKGKVVPYSASVRQKMRDAGIF